MCMVTCAARTAGDACVLCVRIRVHAHVYHMHTHVYTRIYHVCTRVHGCMRSPHRVNAHRLEDTCICICIYAHAYIDACMHVSTQLHTHVCKHVHDAYRHAHLCICICNASDLWAFVQEADATQLEKVLAHRKALEPWVAAHIKDPKVRQCVEDACVYVELSLSLSEGNDKTS